jgi:metal-responsive CopG/Arc/MetJ family transcriptional regulator
MVMSRKQVLVQLDDELVSRLDELAAAEGTNRSDLLRRGAVAVLEAADLTLADRELQEAYRNVPQEIALVKAARRLAARTVPEW